MPTADSIGIVGPFLLTVKGGKLFIELDELGMDDGLWLGPDEADEIANAIMGAAQEAREYANR